MNYQTLYESPIGTILLEANDLSLLHLDFLEKDNEVRLHDSSHILKQTTSELDEYFKGKRMKFTVSMYQEGTPFQLSVWNALKTIPYGEVKSYQDIATQIGNVKAVRAVGLTNGKNPIGIIVPCHRVIGKNGKMVGYASGVWRKEWLLQHEHKHLHS